MQRQGNGILPEIHLPPYRNFQSLYVQESSISQRANNLIFLHCYEQKPIQIVIQVNTEPIRDNKLKQLETIY